MIKLDGIQKEYLVDGDVIEALKPTSLEIQMGEIFGIIGNSGAGKSTLLHCLNLLERPTSGTVTVNKLNLTMMADANLRASRRHIGMIFQHFNLLSSRTVYENIALPLELIKYNQQEINDAIIPLLKLTGLYERRNYYPTQLSGGQKQRVAIARALAPRPKVLLCDEATSSLDPRTTESILSLLRTINEEFKVTIVLITHEMDVIKSICDRVAVLSAGEIVELGPVVDIFTKPKAKVTKDFVNSTLRKDLPQAFRRKLRPTPGKVKIPVVRITFAGETSSQPLVGLLIKKFHLNVNIIQANIENIGEDTVGVMVIEIQGESDVVEKGIQFLRQKRLNIEIIGYVAGNIKSN